MICALLFWLTDHPIKTLLITTLAVFLWHLACALDRGYRLGYRCSELLDVCVTFLIYAVAGAILLGIGAGLAALLSWLCPRPCAGCERSLPQTDVPTAPDDRPGRPHYDWPLQ